MNPSGGTNDMVPNPHGQRPGAAATWRGHNGHQPPADALFFGDPQNSIGQVLSGATQLKADGGVEGGVGKAMGRLVGSVFGGAAVGAGGYGIGHLVQDFLSVESSLITLGGAAIFGTIGFAGSFIALPTRPVCSYVGKEGLLRFRKTGQHVDYEWMRFEHAKALTFNQTRNYTNGVYTGTTYGFAWKDAGLNSLFHIGGHFSQKESQQAPANNEVHFAHAAETAWTQYLLSGFEAELAAKGRIEFNVNKKDWVAIGDGFMDLHFKGTTERLTNADIQNLNLSAGFLTIEQQGAKKGIFSSSGVFRFSVNGMDNFRYFLVVLDVLMGYRF